MTVFLVGGKSVLGCFRHVYEVGRRVREFFSFFSRRNYMLG